METAHDKLHFSRRKHHRQEPCSARRRDSVDARQRCVQHGLVEEDQGSQRLVLRAGRHALLDGKAREKLTHTLCAQLSGMSSAVKADVRHDPVAVCCLRPRSVSALAHPAPHHLHQSKATRRIGRRAELRIRNARRLHAATQWLDRARRHHQIISAQTRGVAAYGVASTRASAAATRGMSERRERSSTGPSTGTTENRMPNTSMAYWTASGNSSSPRGEGCTSRQARKNSDVNRHTFMLTVSERSSRAYAAASGFSITRRSVLSGATSSIAYAAMRSAGM